jgi:peptidoglycan LD-endopeptidase LytH
MIPQSTDLRRIAAIFITLMLSTLVAACGGGNDDDPGVGSIITPGVVITTPEPSPAPTSPTAIGSVAGSPTTPPSSPVPGVTASPTATSPNGDPNLRGFIMPISGGCLPKGDQLMPNAPRPYRNGTHEGVDFYNVDNCTAIGKGTPVLAAKAGTVTRADLNYVNPTPEQMSLYLANPNTDASLDAFRGRQVWVRHDDGSFYVTRYAHLDGVAPGITVGTRVTAGQLIAFVGETGTPESLTNPGNEYHLHFEMRIGGSYLGAGLTPAQVRQLFQTLFTP